MIINERLTCLRQLMKQHGVSAVIIPSSDPHMSEYVADHWKSRQYFSGFTGSAGTLVVTLSKSGLWTDGRYYIQAEKQLSGSEITLFKMGQKDVPSYIDYLKEELAEGESVGIDGRLFTYQTVQAMKKAWEAKQLKLSIHLDLAGELWTSDRPSRPLTPVYSHEKQYAGIDCREKIEQVRRALHKQGSQGYVLTELASIAWLFNIRANDIAYNPMAEAYAFVTDQAAYLCIHTSRMPEAVKQTLEDQGVTIKEYEAIEGVLKDIQVPMKVCFNEESMNAQIGACLEANPKVTMVTGEDIVTQLKAIKNPVEIENMIEAHIKDGCALAHFMVAFEEKMARGEVVTEYTLVDMLREARAQQKNNKGESFASIVAYKENAAMMHYAPQQNHNKQLEKEGLLLIDSGGQYLEGTTDITRTFALGPVTGEEKLHYTLTLKSHIAMAKAIFMEGCTGGNLDILARAPMWERGLDYKCGTGHGVGFFLGVHEGPQDLRISNKVPLKRGMVITDEPGVYIEGSHGIRIENILLVTGHANTSCGTFYQFKTITYFPIDTKPLLMELLTEEEITWLNAYHEMVAEKLIPRLEGRARQWVKDNTQPI